MHTIAHQKCSLYPRTSLWCYGSLEIRLVGQNLTWSEGLPQSKPPCFDYGGCKKINTTIYSLRDFSAKMTLIILESHNSGWNHTYKVINISDYIFIE